MLKVLSLGVGVQSTTLALMSARGDLPRVDMAIFADTGWEAGRTYDYLAWLEGQLPFPVRRVTRDGPNLGELMMDVSAGRRGRAGAPMMPFFTANPKGMTPKHCSKEFKVRPIGREVRRLLGIEPRRRGPRGIAVEQWIGISIDEQDRMKDSEQPFVRNRWPLCELKMRRENCVEWLEARQLRLPPRSSCVVCPYRPDAEWLDMRDNDPQSFARAADFDVRIRSVVPEGEAYLHRQRVPLVDVQFKRPDGTVEHGFRQECDAVCGL